MKEIKAYVRSHRIADVLQALKDSGLCATGTRNGCHNLTVAEVLRPFAGAQPAQQHYSTELAEEVITQYKLELVCTDDLADALVEVIAKAAHTGQPEAGWVFVSEVSHAREIA